MNYKIKIYVDKLFADKSGEPFIRDAKEEMLANLNDKYNDLIAKGESEDSAYLLAISNIGEIDELLNAYKEQDIADLLKETEESLDNYTDISDEKSNLERQEKISKKPGLIFLIALAATAVYVLIGLIADNWTLTLAIFPLGAFSSILIIFCKTKKKNLVYGMIWTAAAALYLFISFISDGWAWSWVLFILALGAHEIVRRNLK